MSFDFFHLPTGFRDSGGSSRPPIWTDTKVLAFACAQLWPPLTAPADATPQGGWTVIGRDDGSKQRAYDGKPLYTFAKDEKPGETKGEGFNNVWHVAKP
jgi:predicted lipoprotein with Yx(FWY)xxD motif